MMALPGKLSLGLLQEDNPVKAYFRIQPVAILEEGAFQKLAETEKFPDDGYIRIVPDKNELAQFKTRMRTLGRYCALDLRKFLGENEKIRPNKNYGTGSERNALIVYSDAICPLPSGVALEVLNAQYVFVGEQVTLRAERPCTEYVLVRREGQVLGPWSWTDAPDVEGCLLLNHASGLAFVALDEADVKEHLFHLPCAEGETLLMTSPTLFGVETGAKQAPAQIEDRAAAPLQTSGRDVEIAAEPAIAAIDPAPAPEMPAAPVEPAQHAGEAPSPAAAEDDAAPQATGADKPWIQKTEMPRPRAIAGRISLRDQVLAAQSGINPRKGRSLSEVVDEQWRKSRFDQLGHPVPSEATARPVLSPIDRAMAAFDEAWSLEQARGNLLKALLGNEELREALSALVASPGDQRPGSAERIMEDLESERLKLITEIDALRQKRSEVKAQLVEELKQTHRQDIQKHEQKIAALRKELERNEEAARGAQAAAEAARSLLTKTSEQVEQQMLGHLMTERAIELVMHMNDGRGEISGHPSLYEPTAGELISDLRVQLESGGFSIDNDDAVSLLACLATSGMAVISGPTGSGKSQLARNLAAALGLTGQARRFLEARSVDDPQVAVLLENCDSLTPSILLLDDINLTSVEAVNDAIRLQEEAIARNLPLWLILTVQDAPDGHALSARLLARAFFIRLDAASAEARWKPPELMPPAPDRAVALSAIRDILKPVSELEGEVENRLYKLRGALEKMGYFIDRRTLNELWTYCASVMRSGRLSGMEALDRALSMRALPQMLSAMDIDQLTKLPDLLCDMPLCMKLMEQPLPLPPV